MKKFDYDLFIIGAGSGGVRAARVAAGFGARVAIAEERYLGGTCVNVGCVPKKLLVYASHFSGDLETSKAYGWKFEKPGFSWQELIENKNEEIHRLNRVYEQLLQESGVGIISGRAKLVDGHTVSINNETCTAERILIATGGWPTVPGIPGNEMAITSNDAFFLDALPGKIIIVGGGYIGVEFAGIFNGLGVDVTLVYRGPLILNGFDRETREFLSREMEKKGIRLLLEINVESIGKHPGNGLYVRLEDGTQIDAERVMFATGRHPNTADLGLDTAGVKLDENEAVIINHHFQTSCSSVYAIGDVTNRHNLTPVAIAEGTTLSTALFGDDTVTIEYGGIPTCIFSQPNLATVGHTEESARETCPDISVYISQFTHLKQTLSKGPERTFMKLVVDNSTDRVIGAHMVGDDAGEIIQGIAIAMKAGVTKKQFDSTMGIHPTAAEEFVTMRQPAPR